MKMLKSQAAWRTSTRKLSFGFSNAAEGAIFSAVILALAMFISNASWAVNLAAPPSLKSMPVPEPNNLGEFLRSDTSLNSDGYPIPTQAARKAAIALGKAFFWDMMVGSDDIQACASCHFHAGADNRTKNTLNPGGDSIFNTIGPNGTLTSEMFPFHKLSDPGDRFSTVLSDTNDIVGAQTGARTNLGLRDRYQRHGYSKGEFGSNGLYHLDGTTKGIEARIHPMMPVQDPSALWTFDGTFPPKLLMARYGESILFRHYNALPIDETENFGFGNHDITTHEHNGHNPADPIATQLFNKYQKLSMPNLRLNDADVEALIVFLEANTSKHAGKH